MTKHVSCVIAAYNEGSRIANVLRAVAEHPLVSEVLVVDDGSADNTKEVVSTFPGVRLLALEKNGGKSHAVTEGIKAASGEFIFLLDADLTGLRSEYITALIKPITEGRADISISLRGNSPAIWRWIGLDYISGERVFARSFIQPLLPRLASLQGFGLEVFMNRSLIQHRLRIAVVRWPEVRSALKFHKPDQWWLFGIKKDYVRMAWIVSKTAPPWEMAWQIFSMLRLRA